MPVQMLFPQARVLASIHHDNIIQFFGVIVEPPKYIIIMGELNCSYGRFAPELVEPSMLPPVHLSFTCHRSLEVFHRSSASMYHCQRLLKNKKTGRFTSPWEMHSFPPTPLICHTKILPTPSPPPSTPNPSSSPPPSLLPPLPPHPYPYLPFSPSLNDTLLVDDTSCDQSILIQHPLQSCVKKGHYMTMSVTLTTIWTMSSVSSGLWRLQRVCCALHQIGGKAMWRWF